MKKINTHKITKAVNRKLDIQAGINTISRHRVHKNKKAYDRKAFKLNLINL